MNIISKELVILSYRQTVREKGQVRKKKKKKKELCDNVLKDRHEVNALFIF